MRLGHLYYRTLHLLAVRIVSRSSTSPSLWIGLSLSSSPYAVAMHVCHSRVLSHPVLSFILHIVNSFFFPSFPCVCTYPRHVVDALALVFFFVLSLAFCFFIFLILVPVHRFSFLRLYLPITRTHSFAQKLSSHLVTTLNQPNLPPPNHSFACIWLSSTGVE
ncbi:hypothetical protein K435DRAFT_276268 [Dendrothele bispora CBS 962.96]|uniref:Uncharacterized protein n=1 Tax=Dendrothele bispora (strain CBS 962.96) TaxID=1314807 RepID=A0A4S8LL24_DENBC|nr:hypothetical protein K435DRAFT_276268 [Dendrothele bispora CBS 962.96]